MKSTLKLSPAIAQRLILDAQGLDGSWRLPPGAEGAAQVVERLGYVQIDTIAVVQRAHHHTLWSRCPDYTTARLDELQAVQRRVFEYWARAACYLPLSDYRFYLPRMRAVAGHQRNWFYNQEARAVTDHVLNRIRAEGPLRSVDFKDSTKKRGSWWDWKPAKRALEMLFDMGTLMVTARRQFQRVYDLTERVLPSGTDTRLPTADEIGRFVVQRVLTSRGFATSANLRWERHRPAAVDGALRDLIAAGDVVELQLEDLDEPVYVLATALDRVQRTNRQAKILHILSPFDNAVIDRRRLAAFFGFDCKLEAYVPASRRQYGYFCLPLLWGRQFVGRIDPKAERRQQALIIRQLMFEPAFKDYDACLPALAGKLTAFALFNGCRQVVLETCAPGKVGVALKRELRRHGAV